MKKHILPFLIFICFALVFISLFQKENKIKKYNVEKNIELAIYLNDEETNTIPQKEGNIYDETTFCLMNDTYKFTRGISSIYTKKYDAEYEYKCLINI